MGRRGNAWSYRSHLVMALTGSQKSLPRYMVQATLQKRLFNVEMELTLQVVKRASAPTLFCLTPWSVIQPELFIACGANLWTKIKTVGHSTWINHHSYIIRQVWLKAQIAPVIPPPHHQTIYSWQKRATVVHKTHYNLQPSFYNNNAGIIFHTLTGNGFLTSWRQCSGQK